MDEQVETLIDIIVKQNKEAATLRNEIFDLKSDIRKLNGDLTLWKNACDSLHKEVEDAKAQQAPVS